MYRLLFCNENRLLTFRYAILTFHSACGVFQHGTRFVRLNDVPSTIPKQGAAIKTPIASNFHQPKLASNASFQISIFWGNLGGRFAKDMS